MILPLINSISGWSRTDCHNMCKNLYSFSESWLSQIWTLCGIFQILKIALHVTFPFKESILRIQLQLFSSFQVYCIFSKWLCKFKAALCCIKHFCKSESSLLSAIMQCPPGTFLSSQSLIKLVTRLMELRSYYDLQCKWKNYSFLTSKLHLCVSVCFLDVFVSSYLLLSYLLVR